MNTYHVTSYYLATGMEGQAQSKDYGIITAASASEAKTMVLDNTGYEQCAFTRSCLTAELVSSSSNVKEPTLELTEEDEVLTPIEVTKVSDILLRRKKASSERVEILSLISEYTEDLAQIDAELDQLNAVLSILSEFL